MGNRAVITTRERKIGFYLHWNGGRDTVEPMLKYCEMQGFRSPETDGYGWARLAQVVGNFFGGTLSVGIFPYTEDANMDPGDNGIYVIKGWKIVDHLTTNYGAKEGSLRMRRVKPEEEQKEHDFGEMLKSLDESMPAELRLGEYIDSVEIPLEDLRVGDMVWLKEYEKQWRAFRVLGFGQPESGPIGIRKTDESGKASITYPDLPYVGRYCNEGYTWNANNYITDKTVRIKARV